MPGAAVSVIDSQPATGPGRAADTEADGTAVASVTTTSTVNTAPRRSLTGSG